MELIGPEITRPSLSFATEFPRDNTFPNRNSEVASLFLPYCEHPCSTNQLLQARQLPGRAVFSFTICCLRQSLISTTANETQYLLRPPKPLSTTEVRRFLRSNVKQLINLSSIDLVVVAVCTRAIHNLEKRGPPPKQDQHGTLLRFLSGGITMQELRRDQAGPHPTWIKVHKLRLKPTASSTTTTTKIKITMNPQLYDKNARLKVTATKLKSPGHDSLYQDKETSTTQGAYFKLGSSYRRLH